LFYSAGTLTYNLGKERTIAGGSTLTSVIAVIKNEWEHASAPSVRFAEHMHTQLAFTFTFTFTFNNTFT
jgi:hypothetical protein